MIGFIKRFKSLVSLFVVFAMFANVAAPAFAETKTTDEVKSPMLSGWDVVKASLMGAGAGAALGWLLGSGGTIAIAGLALPALVVPAIVGAVVIGGIAYFIKKTTDGVKEGAIDPRARQLEGGLLGTPMQGSGVGER